MWKGTAPSGLLADLVVGYLRPRHVGPVHGGKMHFPTVREFMAHGQWRPAFPTKLPVTLSFPLAPPPPRAPSYHPPIYPVYVVSLRAGFNDFPPLFG